MSLNTYYYKEDFSLESGASLPKLKIAYHTYGKLNQGRNNVVWTFHALTANSDVLEWWPGLFGKGSLFDPSKYFIICSNALGSPYGSTSPRSLQFPKFTVRDVVNAQLLLAKHLQIKEVYVSIGGSFGGSQALEFAYAFKGTIKHMVAIACAAKESAWGIAIHEAQRLALVADGTFGEEGGGGSGLKAARAIGMLTYRTSDAYNSQQTDEDDRTDDFSAASYITYQGEKLKRRFDAMSYYYLTKCLDGHNVGRGRDGIDKALKNISAATLVIGIDSDQLLPPTMQKEIAALIPKAKYAEISSRYGHDGFLIEVKQLSTHINNFLNN